MKLDKKFEKARNYHETWVVYRPTRRFGRRVAFAADNKECVQVPMPMCSTQMAAQPRAEFNGAGEETTHETTYTGIEPIPWAALPNLLPSDKQKIMGYPPETPAASRGMFDASMGVPLNWNGRTTTNSGSDCWRTCR